MSNTSDLRDIKVKALQEMKYWNHKFNHNYGVGPTGKINKNYTYLSKRDKCHDLAQHIDHILRGE